MNCPKCDYQMSDRYRGKPVKCPGCETTVLVSDDESEEVMENSPLLRRPSSQQSPSGSPLAIFNLVFAILTVICSVGIAIQIGQTSFQIVARSVLAVRVGFNGFSRNQQPLQHHHMLTSIPQCLADDFRRRDHREKIRFLFHWFDTSLAKRHQTSFAKCS